MGWKFTGPKDLPEYGGINIVHFELIAGLRCFKVEMASNGGRKVVCNEAALS